jgi:hypothetical protein
MRSNRKKYLPKLESIKEYFDEKEVAFLDFIKSNGEYHEKSLKKAKEELAKKLRKQ